MEQAESDPSEMCTATHLLPLYAHRQGQERGRENRSRKQVEKTGREREVERSREKLTLPHTSTHAQNTPTLTDRHIRTCRRTRLSATVRVKLLSCAACLLRGVLFICTLGSKASMPMAYCVSNLNSATSPRCIVPTPKSSA